MSWYSKIALGSLLAGLAAIGLQWLIEPQHLLFLVGGLLLCALGIGMIWLRGELGV